MGFGTFQANVGKVSADVNVVVAWIFGVLMIMAAIGMAIAAAIPMETIGCDKDKDPNNPDCKKQHHLEFLWGLILIPLAILIILSATWWRGVTRRNKTAAQVGGAVAEVEFVKQIFNS